MIIFYACDLCGRAVRVWDEDSWIRQPGEGVVRRDAVVLFLCGDHAYISMISASQGSWDWNCFCF